MRVAAQRPATLRWHLTSDGGTPVTPDNGATPQVTVVAGDGTVAYGPTNASLATGTEGAEWTWVLPAQSKLDTLTATLTATVGGVPMSVPLEVDIIAQRLIDPWRLRNDYPADLGAGVVDDEQLLFLLDQAEETIRDVLGYPPVLEGARVEWDTLRGTINDALYVAGTVNGLPYGWGAGRMLIPQVRMPVEVYSGSVNGVALDPTLDVTKILVQNGALVWSDYRPWISGRYSLWLTHGDPSPAADLRWACGKLVAHRSKTIDYPDRAAQVVTEGATIVFAMPTADRPTGIPEIDAVLNRYRLTSVI